MTNATIGLSQLSDLASSLLAWLRNGGALPFGTTTTLEKGIGNALNPAVDWATTTESQAKSAVQSVLKGGLPAILDNSDGSGTILGGLQDNADGTGKIIVDQVYALVDHLDGTASGATQALQNAATTASQTAFKNLAGAASGAQQAVDHIVNAANGLFGTGAAVFKNDATAVGTQFSNFFSGMVKAWNPGVTYTSPPTATQAAAGLGQVVKGLETQQTHTISLASINSQLGGFYGGGGASGLRYAVSISGTLPSGFSSVSTIATAAVKYTTPCVTKAQAVEGAWSVADNYAKYLFLRANSTFTTYVYCKLQSNTYAGSGLCEIGCVVGGVKTVFTTFALGSSTVTTNAGYTFEAVGNVYSLSGPSTNVSYTDSGNIAATDATSTLAYVYGGFGHDGYLHAYQQFVSNDSFAIPSWMVSGCKFDIAVIGGGAGGGGYVYYGGGGLGGGGGYGVGSTLTYGTDIPLTTTSLAVYPGPGGGGSPVNYSGVPGYSGSATSVVIPGYGTVTAAGGAGNAGTTGGSSGSAGGYAQSVILNNTVYYGAGPGGFPGGGGSGGSAGSAGGQSGVQGTAWISAIDTTIPGSIGLFALYDAGQMGPTTARSDTVSGGPAPDGVGTYYSTTSTAWTTLGNSGPGVDQITVTIGSSGNALVLLSNVSYTNAVNDPPLMSFAMSGANTQVALDYYAIGLGQAANTSANWTSGSFLLTGLTAGATTFQANYRVNSAGGWWVYRKISVIPL